MPCADELKSPIGSQVSNARGIFVIFRIAMKIRIARSAGVDELTELERVAELFVASFVGTL